MLIPRRDIGVLADQIHMAKQKIVFTNGCFDILHAGHVRYLKDAKCFGEVLIVGLNSDKSVRALKGEGRPVNGEQDRVEVLGALKPVDYVVLFDDATAEALIEEIEPDIYVKGGDYTFDTLPEAKIVASYGGETKFISLVPGRSSTNIINRIKSCK